MNRPRHTAAQSLEIISRSIGRNQIISSPHVVIDPADPKAQVILITRTQINRRTSHAIHTLYNSVAYYFSYILSESNTTSRACYCNWVYSLPRTSIATLGSPASTKHYSPIMPSRSTSRASSYHDDNTLNAPLQPTKSAASNPSLSRLAYHRPSCQQEECEHGLLSPHASPPSSSSSIQHQNSNRRSSAYTPTHLNYEPQPSEALQQSESGNGGVFGGRYGGEENLRHGILGDAVADGVLGNEPEEEPPDGDDEGGEEARKRWKGAVLGMSTTQWLARKHDVRGRRKMYVTFHPRLQLTRCEIEGSGNRTRSQSLHVAHKMKYANARFSQVSGILFSLPELDKAISLVLLSRRPHRRSHNGLLLHPYVPLLRLKPWPYPSHQRPVLVRFQPFDLCISWQLSADGRGP